MAPRAPFHPSDEALLALATDDGADVRGAHREHVRTCDACRDRTVELLRVRTLLRDVAGDEETPKRDLVRGAVRRLTFRRAQIRNVNEFFTALGAIVRGFTTLLSVEEPPFAHPPPRSKRPGEEASRG